MTLSCGLGSEILQERHAAVADITKEIVNHTEQRYLREEFVLIGTKLDPRWKHSDKVEELISRRKRSTKYLRVYAFSSSPPMKVGGGSHTTVCDASRMSSRRRCRRSLRSLELRNCQTSDPPVLVPLHEKETLVKLLHNKLEACNHEQ